MNSLLIGLLSALTATNQPAAVSNFVLATTGIAISVPDQDDPLRQELNRLMQADDAAQAEIDRWIQENRQFAAAGAGIPPAEMNRRIRRRFEPVRQGYEDFIARHPRYAPARIAYASFLDDIGDEEGGRDQLETARELDPKDPAVWNNLANYYGHRSPVKKAFAYYAKAIELDPREPVYYWNFGTTVYLFRKDAMEFYGITEPQVFDKALDLYAQALKLDPANFELATDLAQSYYGIRPTRTEDALVAWTNAMQVARDDLERQGVHIHLARFKYKDGRLAEARGHLNAVTNDVYADLKKRLLRNIEELEKER